MKLTKEDIEKYGTEEEKELLEKILPKIKKGLKAALVDWGQDEIKGKKAIKAGKRAWKNIKGRAKKEWDQLNKIEKYTTKEEKELLENFEDEHGIKISKKDKAWLRKSSKRQPELFRELWHKASVAIDNLASFSGDIGITDYIEYEQIWVRITCAQRDMEKIEEILYPEDEE